MARARTRLLAVGLGALFISASSTGCGDDDSEPVATSSAGGNAVEVVDFAFEPAELDVEPGTTVAWTNAGEQIHNVKAIGRGPGFFSEAMNPGDEFEHRFSEPGTYDYLCTLHPEMMKATITVSG